MLNKLLTEKMIKKEKVGTRFTWSLIQKEDTIIIADVSIDENKVIEENLISEQRENKLLHLSNTNHRESYIDLLKLVYKNFIDDILFLRK